VNQIRNSSRLQQSALQKLARAGLLLVVTVVCSQGQMVQAAQLGAPEIRSYLGEPLQARIALENVSEDTIAAAKTSLAPPVEWARQGAGIYPEDLDLTVTIERDETGYYVNVQSRQPVSEPVLQLLLDLQMPQQPLVSKPYILFLDPKPSPGDLARRSLAARQSQRLAAARNDSPDSAKQNAAAAESASDNRTSESTPSTGQAVNAGSYGPVERGETLWSIAQRYAVSTPMTAQQWLVAFQHANPQALQDPANVNTLRSGAILDIPDAQTVAGITQYDAVAKLREQNMAWSNSGGRLQLLDAGTGSASNSATNESVAALRIARLQEELLVAQRENKSLREQLEILDNEVDLRDEEISRLKSEILADAASKPLAESLQPDDASNSSEQNRRRSDVQENAIADASVTAVAASELANDSNKDTSKDISKDRQEPESDAVDSTGKAGGTALAAQMSEANDSWYQSIGWLPDSLSGVILIAALLLLLLAMLFWVLRSVLTRSSDDSEYQNMLTELNRHKETSLSPGSASGISADFAAQSVAKADAAAEADSNADTPMPPLPAMAGHQAESTVDASTEQMPHASDDDSGDDMDDDWRDQITTIMDQVDEVEEKEDLPSLAADDSEASRAHGIDKSDDFTHGGVDRFDDDGDDEAKNERRLTDADADSDQEQVIAPLSFDIDDNKDGQSTAVGASDQHEDDTASHADDAHEDLPSPAIESDEQEIMTSGDAGDEPVQSADDELTTPLAFSTDAAGDDDPAGTDSTPAAVDDSTSDPAADEQQHESAVDADELMPPLSFDEFSADMDAAAETASSDQDTWTDSSEIEPMQTNFDPFAESMPEPDDNADDWLQDSVEEQTSGTEDEPDEPDTAAAPATQAAAFATQQDTSPADVEDSDDDDFDNIEIKLDLARAYLAMGDQQAFRILLDEIGDQGSAAQREEIAALLQQLDN